MKTFSPTMIGIWISVVFRRYGSPRWPEQKLQVFSCEHVSNFNKGQKVIKQTHCINLPKVESLLSIEARLLRSPEWVFWFLILELQGFPWRGSRKFWWHIQRQSKKGYLSGSSSTEESLFFFFFFHSLLYNTMLQMRESRAFRSIVLNVL